MHDLNLVFLLFITAIDPYSLFKFIIFKLFLYNYYLCFTAPEPVEDALVILVGNVINITWSPPFISNGEILQYIVRRVNSSGKFYYHISGNKNYLELPFYNDALVFISAVNQYGQSNYEVAKSNGMTINMYLLYSIVFIISCIAPCLPSPCVNGLCVTNVYDQYCYCPDSFHGRFCESTQKVGSGICT